MAEQNNWNKMVKDLIEKFDNLIGGMIVDRRRIEEKEQVRLDDGRWFEVLDDYHGFCKNEQLEANCIGSAMAEFDFEDDANGKKVFQIQVNIVGLEDAVSIGDGRDPVLANRMVGT